MKDVDKFALLAQSNVYKAIRDEHLIFIFKTIAEKNSTDTSSITVPNLTSREVHFRVSKLIRLGLVSKCKQKYHLTLSGKIVWRQLETIANAIDNQWKLEAVDTLEINDKIAKEEYTEIMGYVADKYEIKKITVMSKY